MQKDILQRAEQIQFTLNLCFFNGGHRKLNSEVDRARLACQSINETIPILVPRQRSRAEKILESMFLSEDNCTHHEGRCDMRVSFYECAI